MTTQSKTAEATFRQILVPTDFGEASARALAIGVEMTKKFGAHLILMHAYELPPYAYPGTIGPAVDFLTPIRAAAEHQLGGELGKAKAEVPGAEAVLRFGVPWQEIVKTALEKGADLIVMGTHGRRGVSHALIGSVAEKVVRASSVPVLTVH